METNALAPSASTPRSNSTSSGAASENALSSDFETFLKMLTVQMENQDPLNPIQSADFAVQLATFSGVEQQVRTNDLLGQLATQLSVGGITQYANWVGLEARAPVSSNFEGAPINLNIQPAPDANQTTLVVKDQFGAEVMRTAIPSTSGPYSWDGIDNDGANVPHGVYSFTLESSRDGTPLANEPVETYARITETRIENGAPVLVFEGGEIVPAADVTALKASE
jgi:flagellar basal-body rod modification protein FlgD